MTIEKTKLLGFTEVREIPNQGICGLFRYLFTVGLVLQIDDIGYSGRYCYQNMTEAKLAIQTWDGNGHPEGQWIKYKGIKGEISNPNLEN